MKPDSKAVLPPATPATIRDDAFDTAEERAQEHVEKARASFKKGDYQASIDNLNAAYVLLPRPIYLFNIAQSYRRMGNRPAAISFYERFVEADPTNSFVGEARNAILELKAFLTQEDQLKREKKPIWKRRWFWGVLIGSFVGVAALTTGLVLGLRPPDRRAPISVEF